MKKLLYAILLTCLLNAFSPLQAADLDRRLAELQEEREHIRQEIIRLQGGITNLAHGLEDDDIHLQQHQRGNEEYLTILQQNDRNLTEEIQRRGGE